MTSNDPNLQRGFGLSTTTYVVIASMVGTGILVSPGYMMASLQNHVVIVALWAVGGVLALCGALCIAELAAALPQAGGEYVYLREAYGPMPAFLAGWTSFFLGFSAPLAVVSHLTAAYLLAPLGLATLGEGTNLWLACTAAGIIIVVTLPNLFGHRPTAWAQSVTTILKLGLFAALVGFGFASGRGDVARLSEGQPIGQIEIGTAASQLFFVMFAYTGWNAASYLAGEVRDPGRVLPRSLILGTTTVVLLYLAVYLVFAYAVPLSAIDFSNAENLPHLAAEQLFGPRVASALSVALGATFLATVNAWVVTGPRVYYAMAQDRLFPALAGRLTPRGRVPAHGMIGQSLAAIAIVFLIDFEDLYKYASVGLSLFALLFVAAVFVLRRTQPDLPRPFRVPGYPIVPAVFLLATMFMAAFGFTQWRGPSTFSLATILIGIPIYYVWQHVLRSRSSFRNA